MPDELTRRVRALEAERLRPVPPPPMSCHWPGGGDLAALAEAAAEHDAWPWQAATDTPEPPGPRDSSGPTQEDGT